MDGIKLGFIGAGNMARAILHGILNKGLLPAGQIFLSDANEDAFLSLRGLGLSLTTENAEVAQQADVLILAVKPQLFDCVLKELAPFAAGKYLVSIAPGISVSYLRGALPGAEIVRVMPNTPLMVGLGATAIARPKDISDARFAFVRAVFSSSGEVAVLEESDLDAVVAVSGSSPAYFFRMAGAMVREAARQGLEEDTALRLAALTMEGAARMLLDSGRTPRALIEQVCSPGGTTVAALSAFDELGFDDLVAEAMRRCTERARELGK